MKLSVFVGTSVDGFIARRDGRYDFLPVGGGEPHGYDEFIASVDTILIGRNTFEVVLKFVTMAAQGVDVESTWPEDSTHKKCGTSQATAASGTTTSP